MSWTSPKTITGDAAIGDRYFRRETINEYFWQEVGKGNHILFVAPRRVGKTSIMKDLEGNCPEGYVCLYQNIEGVKSRNEFYRRLFELILQCVNKSRLGKAIAFIQQCFKKYNIKEIGKSGITFDVAELDYENEIRDLIPKLKEAGVHTVIFLDEFAEVISKLKKQGKEQDAIDILHTLRELRGDDDFRHFTLVFAGSIGLQSVIKSISRPKLINDLHPIETKALSQQEATDFIRQLTTGATIRLPDDVMMYLKEVINHLLPYYIQLMLEEIDQQARSFNNPLINKQMVDAAFDNVLKKNKNFEDWLERLRDYQPDVFPFMNEVLKHAAHKETVSIQRIYDIAGDDRFNRRDDYMDYIEQLENDGYLQKAGETTYQFISPFLREFWLRKYPIYDHERVIESRI